MAVGKNVAVVWCSFRRRINASTSEVPTTGSSNRRIDSSDAHSMFNRPSPQHVIAVVSSTARTCRTDELRGDMTRAIATSHPRSTPQGHHFRPGLTSISISVVDRPARPVAAPPPAKNKARSSSPSALPHAPPAPPPAAFSARNAATSIHRWLDSVHHPISADSLVPVTISLRGMDNYDRHCIRRDSKWHAGRCFHTT